VGDPLGVIVQPTVSKNTVLFPTAEGIDCVQMLDIRPLFEKEMSKGKPSGPVFVNGWPVDCDPRFTAPVNPLYDPSACRDTDWRSKLDVVGYLRFSDFVAHQMGMLYRYVLESEEDENIFDVSLLVFYCMIQYNNNHLTCAKSLIYCVKLYHKNNKKRLKKQLKLDISLVCLL